MKTVKTKHTISKLRRTITTLMLIVIMSIGLSVPSYAAVSVSDLDGHRAGVMTGTPQDQIINNAVKDANISYFNSFPDMALALKKGKIDFFVNSTVSFMMMESEYPEFTTTDESLAAFDLGIIFPMNPDGEELKNKADEYIKKIRSDGTLQKLQDYWFSTREKEPVVAPKKGENGTLKMATCSTTEPFSYLIDGRPSGFDLAIVADFCREYGYGLQIDDMDLGGVISAIGAGKYDLAASQISWTKERAESILYSDTYYIQQLVGIIRKDQASVLDNSKGFFTGLKDSFHKTFIKESRWKLIVYGMWHTIALTLLAALFGSIIGYGVCMMRRGRSVVVTKAAKSFIKLFQGTPVVVLLLIMYYLVFGNTQVPAFWVAVVAFSLNFAAYCAEIMRSGIDSIDKGQREAALALGYTERQTFYNFIMPQAAVRFMPVMKGQIISLLKGTAVVGYIAILDLSRAGDIIRSRTYEAFFPLITTAIVYFILAWLLTIVLDQIEISVDPRAKMKNKNRARGEVSG